MTCEEFRSACHRLLDRTLGEAETRRLRAHAERCHACAADREAFGALDAELRRLPTLEPSADLVRKLERLPELAGPRDARVTWRPELSRTLLYALAAVIVVIVLGELPPKAQAAGDVLLAFAGTLAFFLSVLRPVFLPGASPAGVPGRSHGGDIP